MVSQTTRSQFEQNVLSRLRGLARRLRLYLLVDGLAVVSLALLSAILLSLGLDRMLRLSWDMRFAQLAAIILTVVAIVRRFVVQPLQVAISDRQLAVLVERKYPQLQSRLVSAVEFAEPSATDPGRNISRSPAMLEAVVINAQNTAADLRFTDILAHSHARRRAGIVACCVGVLILMILFAESTMGLWFKRNVLLQNINWPQQNSLTVLGLTDGRMIVPRGEDVTISAVVDEGFSAPRQAYIDYTSETGLSGSVQMPAVISREAISSAALADEPSTSDFVRFNHTFDRLSENLRCQVTGGDARTEWFTIEVVDRPRVAGVAMRVEPPAYTKIPPYDLRPGQTVAEVLKGSKVYFRITTNKPIAQATLVRKIADEAVDAGSVEAIGHQELAASDQPENSATYYFRLMDDLGISNLSERTPPVQMLVRLQADRSPKVRMQISGVGEMITLKAILPIEVDISDTYGLASAEIVYEHLGDDVEEVVEPIAGFDPGTKSFKGKLDWVVAAHKLAKGDQFSLHARAADFDNVSGPNIGRSAKITFRVVSREELLLEVNRQEQEYRQEFERLIRLQEDLYSSMLTLSESDQKQEDPAERPRKFQQLARRQRDYAGRMNGLKRQFDRLLSELRANQLSSPTVDTRLGGGVVEPLGELSRSQMPTAAERLDQLAKKSEPEDVSTARQAQDQVLGAMNRILTNMLKYEQFEEAVTLLRQVLEMQGGLNRETERRIEAEIFGDEPSPESNQKQ